MRYAIWNNKGGVGKTFLSFILSTEYANKHPDSQVVVADMCPQANLSEIILGGSENGAHRLEQLINEKKTIGAYFDSRVGSPHAATGREIDFLIHARDHNKNVPDNLWLIAGDPALEIQAQVINQISSQTLPPDAWKNVHLWLRDMLDNCSLKLGEARTEFFVDCNPSFSAYTELAMMASERLIVPCSSDGSSVRAISNLGILLYGIGNTKYPSVQLKGRADQFGLPLPLVYSIVMNRSTQYDKKASKAFNAMFNAIKERAGDLKAKSAQSFVGGDVIFNDIPDSHSVAIVCSHSGIPLFQLKPGPYQVYDENPQVNPEPLQRYKDAVAEFIDKI